MTTNDGGPAFPRPMSEDRTSGDLPDGNRMVTDQPGMSLRDWFAGQALQGLLAFSMGGDEHTIQYEPADAARYAYRFADAMLAARGRPRA